MRSVGGGGGPPRKSHTKSRKGCRTCKTRHIRCDELFPQCRNCSKHNVRCDYMDVSKAGDEPLRGLDNLNLVPSAEMQRALDTWRLTGEPPVAELRMCDSSYWTRFPTNDLRLVQHIVTLSSDLFRKGYSACFPLTLKLNSLISLALSNDFVMDALLAVSASHLAWLSGSQEIGQLIYDHVTSATRGLHEAMTAFSEHNSEGVLAASILLSWQAKDWQSWTSLQHNITTILNTMRPWLHHSELALFLEQQMSFARARHSVDLRSGGVAPSQPSTEEFETLRRMVEALQTLKVQLSHFPDHMKQYIDVAIDLTGQIQYEFPMHDPVRQFELLQSLQSLVLWLPARIMQPEDSDLGALSMMAHFFALAMVLEPFFTACHGLPLGGVSLEPLQNIVQTLQTRLAAMPQDTALPLALSMLEIPRQIAQSYRLKIRPEYSDLQVYRTPLTQATNLPAFSVPNYTAHDPRRQLSYPSGAIQNHHHNYAPNFSYLGYPSSMSTRTDSIPSQTPSNLRLSTSSSVPSLASPQSMYSEQLPTPGDYYTNNVPYTNTTDHPQLHPFSDHTQSRLVSPHLQASVWT